MAFVIIMATWPRVNLELLCDVRVPASKQTYTVCKMHLGKPTVQTLNCI